MKITEVKVDTSERVATFIVELEAADTLGDVLRVANAIEVPSDLGPIITRADHVHPVAKPEVSAFPGGATVQDAMFILGAKPGESLIAAAQRIRGEGEESRDEVERLKAVSDDKDEQIAKLNDKVDNVNAYSSQMENLYMAIREALRIDVFVAPEVALTRARAIGQASRPNSSTDGGAEVKRLTAALESLEKSYAERMKERDDADLKGNALRKEVERLNSALTERDATCGKLKTSNDELAARLQEAGSVISQQNSFRRAVAMAVGLGEAAEPSTIVITIDKLVAERDRLKAQATVPAEEQKKPIPSGRATFCSCTSITRPLEKDGATYCSQCGLAIPVVVKLAELPSNGRGGANG